MNFFHYISFGIRAGFARSMADDSLREDFTITTLMTVVVEFPLKRNM
jgi:hypothetical protein